LRRRESFHYFSRVHPERQQRRQARVERRIVDFVGMQLLLDPLVHANIGDSFGVARARAEGQPAWRVHRPLGLTHLRRQAMGRRCLLFVGGKQQ